MHSIKLLFCAAALILAAGCSSDTATSHTGNGTDAITEQSDIHLHEALEGQLWLGQTLSDLFLYRYAESIGEPLPTPPPGLDKYSAVIWQSQDDIVHAHTNALTAENAFKWHKQCEPSRDQELLPGCSFADESQASYARLFLKYAENLAKDRDVTVVLHAPVWPEKTIEDEQGRLVSFCESREGDALITLPRDKIEEKISEWFTSIAELIAPYAENPNLSFELDALNEYLLSENNQVKFKPFCFDSLDDMTAEEVPFVVFREAREAMANHIAEPVKLLYNDNLMVSNSKIGAVSCLVQALNGEAPSETCDLSFTRSETVLIDGISLQAHWTSTYPAYGETTGPELEPALQRYALLGIDVNISEYDIGPPDDFLAYDETVCRTFGLTLQSIGRYRHMLKRFTTWGISEAKLTTDQNGSDYLQLFRADGSPRFTLPELLDLLLDPDSVDVDSLCH